MPYKKNRLRLKRERISKKRSELGKLGNQVKRDRMRESAGEMRCEGGLVSFGKMGSHCIKLYSCSDDPLHYWIRVDGEMRNPRTVRGVKAVAADWVAKFAVSETNKENDHIGFIPDWSI